MTMVGAMIRVQAEKHDIAWQALAQLPGVTPFALDDADRLGLLIECDELDDAYRLLEHDVPAVSGVQGAYPAYAYFETCPEGLSRRIEGIREKGDAYG